MKIVLLFYGEAIKKRALVMIWTRIVGQVGKITDSISEHFIITDQYRNISNKVLLEHSNFKRSTFRNIVT